MPKITKSLAVTQCSESFADFLQRKVGTHIIPLSYVNSSLETVPIPPPPLEAGEPFAAEYGSVKGELVSRASHAHALFRDDNATVYYFLEESTRDTNYSASIKPFQRSKNGREA